MWPVKIVLSDSWNNLSLISSHVRLVFSQTNRRIARTTPIGLTNLLPLSRAAGIALESQDKRDTRERTSFSGLVLVAVITLESRVRSPFLPECSLIIRGKLCPANELATSPDVLRSTGGGNKRARVGRESGNEKEEWSRVP